MAYYTVVTEDQIDMEPEMMILETFYKILIIWFFCTILFKAIQVKEYLMILNPLVLIILSSFIIISLILDLVFDLIFILIYSICLVLRMLCHKFISLVQRFKQVDDENDQDLYYELHDENYNYDDQNQHEHLIENQVE